MPVRGRTRHDPPMRKQPKGPSMFAATDSGAKPHREALAAALKVTPQKLGKQRTLTR